MNPSTPHKLTIGLLMKAFCALINRVSKETFGLIHELTPISERNKQTRWSELFISKLEHL